MDASELQSNVSRRKLIATGGGLLAGGVTWATVGTTGVRASVDAGGFAVSDGSTEVAGGSVYSPVIDVDAAYAYEGADAATQSMLAVLIDGTLVTSTVFSTAGGSDSGRRTLSAVVVESQQWASEDWDAPSGGQVAHDVAAEVRFEVRDSAGDTLASAAAQDSTTITVSDGGAALAADVGGDGSVRFADNESDV